MPIEQLYCSQWFYHNASVEKMAEASLREQLDRLPKPVRQLLRGVGEVALARGAEPYLVGGTVRDLLLGRETVDLDILVVGDAIAVAAACASETGAELQLHEQFGTAKLEWADGRQLDLITARHERYPEPGALPVVTPGTLDDDLRRRDFTINAIAASLAPSSFGRLADPLGGQFDLTRGLVRVLHAGSFRDDPTRIPRAVRYAGRLSFVIERQTERWLREAIAAGAPATVSIDRMVHEFIRLLAEPAPGVATMVHQLAELGLLSQLHPALRWDDRYRQSYAVLETLWPLVVTHHAGELAPPRWMVRFAVLMADRDPDVARTVARDLHLPAAAVKLAEEVARLRRQTASAALDGAAPAAVLGRLLDPYSPAAIVALVARWSDTAAGAQLRRYLVDIRDLTPTLTGDFIRALGVRPGPIYREALAALRDRKRDHPALTVEGEGAFLRDWFAARGLPR